MKYAVKTQISRRFLMIFLTCLTLLMMVSGCARITLLGGPSPDEDQGAGSHFIDAQRFYDSGQFQQAIESWEQVPPTDPAYIDAQFGIREARLRIKELQEEHIVSAQVRSKIDALISQAEQFEKQGDLNAAVQQYEQARQYDPKNNFLYNKIEELHALLDDTLERFA